jgi:hypothetical protein
VRPGDRAGLLSDRAVDGYAGMLAVLKLHAACYRRQILSQAIGSAPDPMTARHYPPRPGRGIRPPLCPSRRHGVNVPGHGLVPVDKDTYAHLAWVFVR